MNHPALNAGAPRRPLVTGCALLLSLTATSFAQYSAEFSAASLGSGDSDALVGLSTSKEYFAAANLGEAVNYTVNGVTFTGVGGANPVGGNYTFTNVPNVFPGGVQNPGGVLGQMTDKFVYGALTTAETLTLNGLTIGESYVVTFYNKSWEAQSVGRRITTTASGASAFAGGFTYDEDMNATAAGSLSVLRYTFQAATAQQLLNFIAQVSGTTMHQYGFTVERTFNNAWTAGTDWSTATWGNGTPIAPGSSAAFGAQAAPTSINLDTDITVGHLRFDSANAWTVASSTGRTLTLQADVGGVSNLNAKSGAHTISTNVALANNLLKTGAGSVTISGVVSGAASVHLGGGTLRLTGANTFTGEDVIAAGGALEVTSVSDYGVPSGIGARTFAQENNTVTGIGLHFQGGTLRFVGSTPQSTNRQIRVLTGVNGGTIDASGTTPAATLSFTFSGTNINLFDTGGTRTINLVGTNTGANTFAIQLTDQAASATSFNKGGAGTWFLTNNANNYTGLTQISGGILNVASVSDYGVPSAIGARNAAQETATGNGIGFWFGPNTSTGTLQYTGATAQSTNRQIRVGTGGATFDASGSTPAASLAFTYSGTNTNLYDTGGARAITLTGSNTGANLFAIQLTDQATTGLTSVNKRGAGTWNLTNVNSTYGGVTAIEGGILNVASIADYGLPSALGNRASAADVPSNVGLLFRGGTLQFTGSIAQTTNRSIRVGTAGATIDASGTSAAATLSFTSAASADFFENGGDRALTLTGNNPGPNVFGMAIPETGGVTTVNKSGTGLWVLTGASSYTGATNVTAGTLQVNGSLANTSVTVNGGAAIGGSGSIAGPVAVLDGGRVAPGAGVGTSTVASLSLAANAGLNLEFGATADLINVTTPGGLTINGGGINLFAEGGTAPFTTNGTYTIIDYDTSFTGTVGNFSVLNSQAGKFYNITDDSASTSLKLTISDATITEWNTTAANGTWTTGANWTGGAPNSAGLVAKFGTIASAAATIATNGPKTVGGLLFGNANGYTITGGASDTITLNNGLAAGGVTVSLGAHTIAAPLALSGNLSVGIAANSSLAVTGGITGAGRSLFFTGPGTLILAGTNTYGSTTVTSGTLQVGMSGTAGNLGSGDVNLSAGATLHFNRSDAITVANNLIGTEGVLKKSGAGTVTLAGTNTIGTIGAGLVDILSGTLALGSPGALPANVNVTVEGGVLDLNGQNASIKSLNLISGSITESSVTAGTTVLNLNLLGNTVVTGAFAKGPTRVLAVNLNTGTLQIGDGGTVGTLAANNLNLATGTALNVNRSNAVTIPTDIAGSAPVNQNGTGTTTLSGVNTFPTLNVNAGTLKLGSLTAVSPQMVVNVNGRLDLNEKNVTIAALTGTGLITDNGASATTTVLTINQAVNATFSGTIEEGAGQSVGLTKLGNGILTLDGPAPNTYAGQTTITGGTLQLQKTNANAIVGNITIGDAVGSDILQLGASDQIGDASVVTFTAGGSGNSAFFRLNGFNETVRGIQTSVGQASVLENNGAAGTTSTLTVDTGAGSYTYDGIIRNASVGTSLFALTKRGTGTLTLANTAAIGNDSHTGATTIEEGKLVMDNLAAYASPIVVNSTLPDALTYNQTVKDLTTSSVISGAGAVIKNGPLALNLLGASTMTGSITVNDGILGLGNPTPLGTATIILNGGSIRAVNAGRSLSNPVTVTGNFTLGRLTDLTGPITLNNNATITANNPDGPANNNSILGPIAGNFRVSFAEGPQGIGTGALVIGGINTNAGTSVLSGRVNVASSGALANGDLVVDGGELNMSNTAQAITSLSGAGGTLNLNIGHTLTVTQVLNTSFAGIVNGGGALTKAGAGTLQLTGQNFGFFGATTISEGTLLVTGSLSGSAISASGGTLGGSGTVGNVVSIGGTIAPGEGTGTLSTNNLDSDAFGNWRFDLSTPGVVGGGVNDLLQITGSLTLDGILQVQRLPGFGGGVYRLANYTGALTDNGLLLDPAFAQLYPGATIDTSISGQVNLVIVPEPASAVFLVSGLGLLAGFGRRRRA